MYYYDEGGNRTFHSEFKESAKKDMFDFANKNEPIRRGCNNGGLCFCTGACQEIIGWREKTNESFEDMLKKVKEMVDARGKGSTVKIAEPEGRGCTDPSHNPPGYQVFSPGKYKHTCPSCGNVIIFVVPQVWYRL